MGRSARRGDACIGDLMMVEITPRNYHGFIDAEDNSLKLSNGWLYYLLIQCSMYGYARTVFCRLEIRITIQFNVKVANSSTEHLEYFLQ